MKILSIILSFYLIPVALFSQPVTDNNGAFSLGTPVLDVQGSVARIVHGTNPWYYTFSVNGPSAPITNPKFVDKYTYGPVHVALGGNGNNVYVPYIDYVPSSTCYYLKYVMSGDNGANWSASMRIDSLTTAASINTKEDNLQLKVSSKGNLYCVWRNQADTNAMYLAVSSSGLGFVPRQRLPVKPSATTDNVCLTTLTIGGTDNLFLTYRTDTTLYLIRSTNEGATFGQPQVLTRIGGMGSYFSGTQIVGNSAGKMYVLTGFWQMGQFNPGFPPMDKSGTILLASSDFGANWNLVDTLAKSAWSGIRLMITSSGSLVSATSESSNVNIRSSLSGKLWSNPVRVNPSPGSATGTYTFGMSSVLIDDKTIAVAWIDTSNGGFDEIYYRKMSVPTAPLTDVDDAIGNSIPTSMALGQNYPNPFNPETKIEYTIQKSEFTRLVVYDLLGREIAVLVNEVQVPGSYIVRFDASNLQSGTYFYRLIAGAFQAVRKMVVLK